MIPGYQIRAKGEPFTPLSILFFSTNSQRQKSVTHGASLSSFLFLVQDLSFPQPIHTHRSKVQDALLSSPILLISSPERARSQQNQIAFAWTAPSTTNRSLPPNLRDTPHLSSSRIKKHHYTISRTLSHTHTHKKEHTRFFIKALFSYFYQM